jgi:hypothetical protein
MYAKRYKTETDYQIIHYYNGGSRVIPPDQHDYLDWLAAGGVPMIETAGRFLSIVDGQLVVDPNKAAILAAEETAKKVNEAKQALAAIDIKSIRSIREYIAAKEDAPKYLKDYEAEAVTVRVNVK